MCVAVVAAAALKVIVERYKKEKLLPAMDKSKFLLPEDLSVAQFSSVVRCLTYLQLSVAAEMISWLCLLLAVISVCEYPGNLSCCPC